MIYDNYSAMSVADKQLRADCRRWQDKQERLSADENLLKDAANNFIRDVINRPDSKTRYGTNSNSGEALGFLDGCPSDIARKLIKVLATSDDSDAKDVLDYVGEAWLACHEDKIIWG